MQHINKKNIDSKKKKILLDAIGEIIHQKRIEKEKGILLFSYEYDLCSNSLHFIEKGARDPQITTLWKIVNALGMNFDDFIKELNKKLPKGFSLIDD